jgi:hypothetical protein
MNTISAVFRFSRSSGFPTSTSTLPATEAFDSSRLLCFRSARLSCFGIAWRLGCWRKTPWFFRLGSFSLIFLDGPWESTLLWHHLWSEVEVLPPISDLLIDLSVVYIICDAPRLTPFSTLTRKGFMYNSYILALTCVMSDLDLVFFAHVNIYLVVGISDFSFFCHRRLARNIFTSLYFQSFIEPFEPLY